MSLTQRYLRELLQLRDPLQPLLFFPYLYYLLFPFCCLVSLVLDSSLCTVCPENLKSGIKKYCGRPEKVVCRWREYYSQEGNISLLIVSVFREIHSTLLKVKSKDYIVHWI